MTMGRISTLILAWTAFVLMPIAGISPAEAQQQTSNSNVVTACGTPNSTYSVGQNRPDTQDTTGGKCIVGSISVTAPAGTVVSTSALAANLVVKNAPAKLVSFNVSADSTLSGAAWWVMIYNATSAPGDGAVTPAKCYAAPSGTTSMSGAFTAPDTFSTGITIGVSTNGCFTKAASTHAFISGDWE